jgi:adenylate cyclase
LQVESPRARRRWIFYAAGALVVLLAVGLSAVLLRRHNAAVGRISIAVLPFANSTGDTARNYLSSGITDELIAQLEHLNSSQLRVIAPTSSRLYAGSNVSPAQIGQQLGCSI